MLSDDLAITWQIFGDFGNYLAKTKSKAQKAHERSSKGAKGTTKESMEIPKRQNNT